MATLLEETKLTALLPKLKNAGFMVKEQDGGYTLVHPSKGKYDWEPDELGFRSLIMDSKGNVVSVGWPKFFNQGEWPETDTVMAGELAAGRAVITHKHDGSLIIRSVLPDGRILFRTRDTFDGGKFAPLAEAVAQAKYPALLDPTVYPDGSLLFEYVGEGNQIVVRYEGGDDLILLGAVTHPAGVASVRYVPYADLPHLAEAHGLRLVEQYDWAEASGGVASILSLVKDWDKAEGVVIRSGDGQTLLKVKSAWYFAQHALRWHQTYESIVRFVLDSGVTDEASLVAKLVEVGWDYEITVTARGHYATYVERRANADRVKTAALSFLESFDSETVEPFTDERARRKAYATRIFGPTAQPETKDLAPYLFLVYDGKTDKLDATLLRRLILKPG